MRCDCCGKFSSLKAVIDGHVCDDCYANGYTFCPYCYELHPNANMFLHPSTPACAGCYDGFQINQTKNEEK
jgi:hypothetical protein